jgi:sigma-B regulation protein RsbU (phosphoserine phosphatase)
MLVSSDVAQAWDAAACGLITLAPDGTIDRANGTIATWLGTPAAALARRPFSSLLTVGSRLFHHTHWLPLLQLQGSVAEVQLELLGGEGRILPMLVNAVALDDRRVEVALFLAKDRRRYERELLDARRRAEAAEADLRVREAEFRTLAENSPDVIARFDLAGRLSYANPAASGIAGRNVEADVGKHLDDLPLAPGSEGFREGVLRALRGEGSRQLLRRETPAGRVDLEAVLVPERDRDGQVTSVLAMTRDVSAARRREDDARQRARFAEELIGIVSHDLRNPLNAVLLGTQILVDADAATRAQVAARILSATERASRLVADLLDFTHARLGQGMPVAPAPIDLHRTVAGALDELRMAAPDRALVHEAAGPADVVADPDRLVQVVANLVQNALAYGDPASPIVVRTGVGERDFTLSVHNQGKPIAADLVEQVFEPLRRGTRARRKGANSVGLGLYIVREIARAHGGDATFTSTAADGTTFVVRARRRSG